MLDLRGKVSSEAVGILPWPDFASRQSSSILPAQLFGFGSLRAFAEMPEKGIVRFSAFAREYFLLIALGLAWIGVFTWLLELIRFKIGHGDRSYRMRGLGQRASSDLDRVGDQ